jgi:hypothetical protein
MINLTLHSRPSAAAFGTTSRPSNVFFLAKLWRDLFKELRSSYRPELHYMRGPGPKWHAKHDRLPAAVKYGHRYAES